MRERERKNYDEISRELNKEREIEKRKKYRINNFLSHQKICHTENRIGRERKAETESEEIK